MRLSIHHFVRKYFGMKKYSKALAFVIFNFKPEQMKKNVNGMLSPIMATKNFNTEIQIVPEDFLFLVISVFASWSNYQSASG